MSEKGLAEFRAKLQAYRRASGISQSKIAQELGLNPNVLSHKLNGLARSVLTHTEVKQIIRLLAEWGAITERRQAVELLELAGLKESSFSVHEWQSAPLTELEITPTSTKSALPVALPGTRRHNLPAQITSLVGREMEIELLARKLSQPQTRLVTLLGPGGVGKTRLALAVAEKLLPQFRDGVFVVNLASLSDPDLLTVSLLEALQLQQIPGKAILPLVKNYLSERQTLLVLDNFEHLLAAAPLVTELLETAPKLQILVTSRSALRRYGEQLFNVPPLERPGSGLETNLAQLEQFAAVRLFCERAEAVQPHFALTAANAGTVSQICRYLDGLPLALELAASRLRLLSLPGLVEQLSEVNRQGEKIAARFKLLQGPASLAPRHRTLLGTLEWSYKLLPPAEQEAFGRLGIFRGGWTAESAAAICDVSVGTLEELLNHSLLEIDANTVLGSPRFTMLETMREYAVECVLTSAETGRLRERHACYFLDLARQVTTGLNGLNYQDWLAKLEAEQANARQALDWFAENEWWDELGELVAALSFYWELETRLSEGLGWLRRALAVELSPVRRAAVLVGAGRLAARYGEHAQARAWLTESLALYRKLPDERRELARCLAALGVLANDEGINYNEAIAFHEESLAIFSELGDEFSAGQVTNDLAWAKGLNGQGDTADRLLAENLARYERLGDVNRRAWVWAIMAVAAWVKGDYGTAFELHLEAMLQAVKIGDKWRTITCLLGLAVSVGSLGHYELATRLYAFQTSLAQSGGVYLPAQLDFATQLNVEQWAARLGETAFEAARQAGKTLTLEQVLVQATELKTLLSA